jgi:hypothetical protein
MSLTNSAENSIVDLFFNATTWANVAINATSSPLTSLELSAHTSDPGETGDQTTNETSYGAYARVAVTRNSGGFTVSGNAATLTALTSFPQCSSSTATLTHFGIGSAHTSTGVRYMNGTISPNISVATGVTPQLTTATSISFD